MPMSGSGKKKITLTVNGRERTIVIDYPFGYAQDKLTIDY